MNENEIWLEVVDHLGLIVPQIWIDELKKKYEIKIRQDAPTSNTGEKSTTSCL